MIYLLYILPNMRNFILRKIKSIESYETMSDIYNFFWDQPASPHFLAYHTIVSIGIP